jgi:membrane-associated phospholipid phosphatase
LTQRAILRSFASASWLSLALLAALPASAQTVSVSDAPGAFEQSAPSSHRLQWNEQWPRFRSIGYAASVASISGALVATLLIPYPDKPRWTGGILLDGVARRALRARHPTLRDAIRLTSDLTLLATIAQAALVDGFLVPAADRNFDVAWQLTLMNAQAFSLNIFIATVLFKAAARARPPFDQCTVDPEFDPFCERGSFASFPSSHTSTAFTAAGLTCVHHANLPLYGGDPWDTLACVGSLALATATGLFRIIGDRHYLSDVLLGAAIGLSLGYLYPYLLHYRYGKNERARASDDRTLGLGRGALTMPHGFTLMGVF